MKIGWLTFAAAAAEKTENFYNNGLEEISSDFTTIINNSDIKDATAARYVEKIEKLVERIQAKHDKLNELDGISFPALDGDLEIDAGSDIDVSKTCQAINLIKNDLKNWAKFFAEAAVRECDGDKCFKPAEGPLKSFETHQNWHKNNSKWVGQFNGKIDSLIKKTRMALGCGKFLDQIRILHKYIIAYHTIHMILKYRICYFICTIQYGIYCMVLT